MLVPMPPLTRSRQENHVIKLLVSSSDDALVTIFYPEWSRSEDFVQAAFTLSDKN